MLDSLNYKKKIENQSNQLQLDWNILCESEDTCRSTILHSLEMCLSVMELI